ncbi:MAG: IS110 family transposase, partial [Enterococcus sp.]|nr:IS110 family transposase [Enterococcus sp.]
MIYVGIDIAKNNHVACAIDKNENKIGKELQFSNTLEGFKKLENYLHNLQQNQDEIQIAMEATGNYWRTCFYYLNNKNYETIVMNPLSIQGMRMLDNKTRIKNDKIDSYLIAETLASGKFKPSKMIDPEMQEIRNLGRLRSKKSDEMATVKTNIKTLLSSYFPEFEKLFSNLFGATPKKILEKYSLPENLGNADIQQLTKMISQTSKGRHGEKMAQTLVHTARTSVGIRVGTMSAKLELKMLLKNMESI